MVPVSWALASADVNAGTAKAARIAMIAITTSSSISVNAVNFFSVIFIVDVYSCSCSEGFCLARWSVAKAGASEGLCCSGVFGLGWLFASFSGVWSEAVGAYRRGHRECQQLFLLFLGVTRIAKSLA